MQCLAQWDPWLEFLNATVRQIISKTSRCDILLQPETRAPLQNQDLDQSVNLLVKLDWILGFREKTKVVLEFGRYSWVVGFLQRGVFAESVAIHNVKQSGRTGQSYVN